jgi:hypothetical protein
LALKQRFVVAQYFRTRYLALVVKILAIDRGPGRVLTRAVNVAAAAVMEYYAVGHNLFQTIVGFARRLETLYLDAVVLQAVHKISLEHPPLSIDRTIRSYLMIFSLVEYIPLSYPTTSISVIMIALFRSSITFFKYISCAMKHSTPLFECKYPLTFTDISTTLL